MIADCGVHDIDRKYLLLVTLQPALCLLFYVIVTTVPGMTVSLVGS